ncbi:unnamed protein product [Caenorhabditis auriculariae]|uniref:Uncharacterized protein n=1 Tax=Caenorhabditis auriculariae TaxID=2777116 RepID=A0A8S1HMI6_9PELO|nr:unnamed protein product [Caenorhabditis auriculariae]
MSFSVLEDGDISPRRRQNTPSPEERDGAGADCDLDEPVCPCGTAGCWAKAAIFYYAISLALQVVHYVFKRQEFHEHPTTKKAYVVHTAEGTMLVLAFLVIFFMLGICCRSRAIFSIAAFFQIVSCIVTFYSLFDVIWHWKDAKEEEKTAEMTGVLIWTSISFIIQLFFAQETDDFSPRYSFKNDQRDPAGQDCDLNQRVCPCGTAGCWVKVNLVFSLLVFSSNIISIFVVQEENRKSPSPEKERHIATLGSSAFFMLIHIIFLVLGLCFRSKLIFTLIAIAEIITCISAGYLFTDFLLAAMKEDDDEKAKTAAVMAFVLGDIFFFSIIFTLVFVKLSFCDHDTAREREKAIILAVFCGISLLYNAFFCQVFIKLAFCG